jgi:hypothetical protein
MGRLSEKFEKMMTAITFAEEGLSDEAIKYLEEEKDLPISSVVSLKGANIWFGIATVED